MPGGDRLVFSHGGELICVVMVQSVVTAKKQNVEG